MLRLHCWVKKKALCPLLILIIWCATTCEKKKKIDSANIIQLNLNITKSLRLALIYFVEILFDQSFAPSVQKLNVHLVVVSTRS